METPATAFFTFPCDARQSGAGFRLPLAGVRHERLRTGFIDPAANALLVHHPVCKACLGHVEIAGAAHVAKADARKISVLRPLRIIEAEVGAGDPHPIVARSFQGLLELIDFALAPRPSSAVPAARRTHRPSQHCTAGHCARASPQRRAFRQEASRRRCILRIPGPRRPLCVQPRTAAMSAPISSVVPSSSAASTQACTVVTTLLAHRQQRELHQSVGFGRVPARAAPMPSPSACRRGRLPHDRQSRTCAPP